MYTVLPELYQEAAARLAEAIDAQNYFSGTILFPFDGAECRMTASVIVYRTRLAQPEGVTEPISDLVPVWWEFHTLFPDGERLNDFSFSEMRTYL